MANYQQQNKADLLREARRRDLDVDDDAGKQDLVNALSEDDRRQAENQDTDQDQDQDRDRGGPRRQQDRQQATTAADDKVRDAFVAHAHGDVPVSDRRADESEAVSTLASDDPRREGQVDAREGVALAEAGNARVQAQFDADQEKGYRGFNPDPADPDAYTISGMAEGKPTPANDPEMASRLREVLHPGAGRFPVSQAAKDHEQVREQAREREQ